MLRPETYHVVGPSSIEPDVWIIYHPFSQSLLEVDNTTSEKLLNCEIYGKNCNEKDVLQFIEFVKFLRPKKIISDIKPKILYILVSGLCNLKCNYCYANRGSYGVNAYNRIMDEKIIEKLPMLIEEFNIEQVNFFWWRTINGIKSNKENVKNSRKV